MGQQKPKGLVLARRYRLVRQIGAGAMGAVWVADDMQTRTSVAIKFLLDEQQDLRERFAREARLLKRLDHPNIVKLLDVGETSRDELFLVLELLSGETLQEHSRAHRRIAPRQAVRIMRDVARAVEAAHAAQIVHRDLKPANVFLHKARQTNDDEFVVKVLDFGVAKSLSSADQTYQTALGVVIGSPAYMSPEQLVGDGVDHRTDLWSMGVMLFELVVGERPFVGTRAEVANQVLAGKTPSLCARTRGVPEQLDRVVMGCLERVRDKRMATASELVSMLSRLLDSDDVWRGALATSSTNVSDTDQTHVVHQGSAPGPSDVAGVPNEVSVGQTASKRRKEARVMTIVAFALIVVLIVLGVVLGLPSKESATAASVSRPERLVDGASAESLEDKRLPSETPPVGSLPASSVLIVVPSSGAPPGPVPTLPPCSNTLVTGCKKTGKSGVHAMPNPYGSSVVDRGSTR